MDKLCSLISEAEGQISKIINQVSDEIARKLKDMGIRYLEWLLDEDYNIVQVIGYDEDGNEVAGVTKIIKGLNKLGYDVDAMELMEKRGFIVDWKVL